MPQPKEEEQSNEGLKNSLSSLGGSQTENQGLSKGFISKLENPEQSLKSCEKAMNTLATDYVKQVESVKEAKEPLNLLQFLNQGEEIWAKESAVIHKFDNEGSEIQFLKEMRLHYIQVLEEKLSYLNAIQSQNPEKKAAQIGLISVMDSIWKEQGKAPNHPVRRHLKLLAQALS
tara:strand:+ start:30 stop:551 length:522 start_codon:yes stop_codon:yes gene_type:complete